MLILYRIAAIVMLILNARSMKREYDKQNLIGVVYWGFMTLLMIIALL